MFVNRIEPFIGESPLSAVADVVTEQLTKSMDWEFQLLRLRMIRHMDATLAEVKSAMEQGFAQARNEFKQSVADHDAGNATQPDEEEE
jgi:hypothetical protein